MRTGWLFASALAVGAPRAACVTCGPTQAASAPLDRNDDADSQRQREQRQWELAQPTGAGAGPAVAPPAPVVIGGAAAAGALVGVGVGAAVIGAGDAGKAYGPRRDEAPPAAGPSPR